jgi:hypothetical protein
MRFLSQIHLFVLEMLLELSNITGCFLKLPLILLKNHAFHFHL